MSAEGVLSGGRGGHSEEAVGVALFVVVGGRDLGVPGQGVAAANAPRSAISMTLRRGLSVCTHSVPRSTSRSVRSRAGHRGLASSSRHCQVARERERALRQKAAAQKKRDEKNFTVEKERKCTVFVGYGVCVCAVHSDYIILLAVAVVAYLFPEWLSCLLIPSRPFG